MPDNGIDDRRVGRPLILITGHPDVHMKNRRLGLHGRRLKASLFVAETPMIQQGHAPGSVSLAGAFYELDGRLSRGSTFRSTEVPFKITYANYSSPSFIFCEKTPSNILRAYRKSLRDIKSLP